MERDCIDDCVILCRSCDLVVRKRALPSGARALCPRCDTVLYDTPYCSINGMLALCITALIFLAPANFLPILELHFFGSVRTTTIAEGAMAVSQQGYWIVGLSVMLTAVIAPALLILSILSQILIIKYQLHNAFFRNVLKRLLAYQSIISQLSMLEIYLISILVSVFNLSDFADIFLGMGTFCFSMLFIVTLFLQREYNLEHMWNMLDE
ncbi:paraquat-inducible protein A [Shewanella hanedai]|uniref:Paraquat-inducible protein A n=1 Tax=Shewanella hanedai TaxID=25 RepID=A0A553JS71_SHEHA|nr:paraquat-inducible protein A [Shewanella hanedai]TRY15298.1 paraquat-inducible protein A [Shewanella hanedai]